MSGEPLRDRQNRLGRGFSALMPTAPAPGAEATRTGVLQAAIEDVLPDRAQPRRHFDESALEELAASIRTKGVIQPILVRRDAGKYRIVAGERRWRAAQRAGLQSLPVLVKDVTEHQAFELALIENIQRQDLSPLEEAEAYRRLIEEHQLTQEACAERVGKDRSSVANTLRLLRLPDDVKEALSEGALDMGHARALLGLADEAALRRAAAEVMLKKLSVRQTEELVRAARGKSKGSRTKAGEEQGSAALRATQEQLQRSLGTRVRLVDNGRSGRIEIDFFSSDERDRLVQRLLQSR